MEYEKWHHIPLYVNVRKYFPADHFVLRNSPNWNLILSNQTLAGNGPSWVFAIRQIVT